MVKSGSFKVSQGSLAGRLGSGIGEGFGKGLAEQFPKELAQQRLSKGLEQFSKNASNLSPLEQYTQLASIPGITPQMLQILPQVLQQQQLAQSLGGEAQNGQVPQFQELPPEQPSAGLTTSPGIEATRKGYIRPTIQQRDIRAKELYQANPKRFGNDPNKAIEYADKEIGQEQARNADFQAQRAGEQNIQRSVQSNLQTQANLLGAKVPGNVYSDIEQRAIKSILPENEGGQGLTDEEAKIKYGEELDEVSRQYDSLKAVGSPTWSFQTPSEILRNLKSVREGFKKRGDLRNLADSYIIQNGLSPGKAYYLAYPPSEIPQLKTTLDKIPDLTEVLYESGYAAKKKELYNPDAILNQIAPKLAEHMGKDGSPLSIAEVLNSKGYNADNWLNYLSENREKLDLTGRQADELTKPRSGIPNLNDIWLFKISNQGKLVD